MGLKNTTLGDYRQRQRWRKEEFERENAANARNHPDGTKCVGIGCSCLGIDRECFQLFCSVSHMDGVYHFHCRDSTALLCTIEVIIKSFQKEDWENATWDALNCSWSF